MTVQDDAGLLIESLAAADSRTPDAVHGIAAQLIRTGALEVGTRLPTIRELAHRSGLSTRSLVAAWGQLRRDGLIETNRRGGTVVVDSGADGESEISWSDRDLLTGSPDYALQPDLTEALLAGIHTDQLNRPGRDYITPTLRDAVVDSWPFPAEAFVAAGGGSEGLLLAVEAAAPAGSVVAVEEPVMPGFLDTLDEVGYTVVGIASDEDGAEVESLKAALEQSPSLIVLQPEGGYSASGSLTAERAKELAEVLSLQSYLPWIVEDDAVGPLAVHQAPSVGAYFPDRTIRVRSYCKAYGMDVKTCVIGGSSALVDRAIHLRVHGIAANSRILQNALAHLISDPEASSMVGAARARYGRRRHALVTALRERGARAQSGPNSLVMWVDVADETGALVELARKGMVVGSGSKSYVAHQHHARLRVAVPQLPDDPARIAELADALTAEAAALHREMLG